MENKKFEISTIEPSIGKIAVKVFITEDSDGAKTHLTFVLDSGEKVVFYHEQDCCESVYINDVVGALQDLVGSPILTAEEVAHESEPSDDYGTKTWTFYKFATMKGYVDVKWLGESNGYYSESVRREVIPADKNEGASELKHISEIIHDEAAKAAFYKFSAELAISEGRGLQSKSDFYEAVFSKESLEDLHDVIRLVGCLRKLGYGV